MDKKRSDGYLRETSGGKMIEDIAGYKIITRIFPFSDSPMEAIRHEIWEVTQLSGEIGAIFYPGKDPSKTLVIFAGHMEKFAMLSVARHVWCNVMIFQDIHSPWYQGSHLLPPISFISEAIEQLPDQELYFFGQSSGAYAALAASRNLRGAKVLAVSPQTFSDSQSKQRIRFGAKLSPATTPDGLLDLRDHLNEADRSTDRIIFCSSSEVENPYESHFWVDHLHVLRLVDLQTVRIFMLRSMRHSAVFHNAAAFAQCLSAVIHSRSPWDEVVERLLDVMSEFETGTNFQFP